MTQITSNPWIQYQRQTPEAEINLFCFSHSGGAASYYRKWSECLPNIFPIQLPGRETRIQEHPYSNLSELIPVLATALSPYLTKTILFFGHSLGALICFELAREIRRRKERQPLGIFVSASSAPHTLDTKSVDHILSDAEIIQKLLKYGGTPHEVLASGAIMKLMLPILRADFSLKETYKYRAEPPLNSSIFAYGGNTDATVSTHELDAWKEHTNSLFQLQLFPGDHFYINKSTQSLFSAILRDIMKLKI
jgi:medium-chain acyl-[acyl-carrier-protein] hydrolase